MSLHGFVAGPYIGNKQPMGANGQQLQEWIFIKATDTHKAMTAEIMKRTGAVIPGNHTYCAAIDPVWDAAPFFTAPALCFVIQ